MLIPAALAAPAALLVAAAPPTIAEGEPFPVIPLPRLDDGQPQTIEAFRGRRVILHVFASW